MIIVLARWWYFTISFTMLKLHVKKIINSLVITSMATYDEFYSINNPITNSWADREFILTKFVDIIIILSTNPCLLPMIC